MNSLETYLVKQSDGESSVIKQIRADAYWPEDRFVVFCRYDHVDSEWKRHTCIAAELIESIETVNNIESA